ncbi:hypothetical protein [Tabrizicola sp.]|jgi:hypothetical protein|uniref:hypothetical protein n=1 Tax=Tabrizicola sp. TaxID=2005166 RepID=UPI001A454F3A|nr:hypothetical protein [Tabrizicola sp.]MBL9062394.1 hypothetical protein [Tabrizicola sp.]
MNQVFADVGRSVLFPSHSFVRRRIVSGLGFACDLMPRRKARASGHGEKKLIPAKESFPVITVAGPNLPKNANGAISGAAFCR